MSAIHVSNYKTRFLLASTLTLCLLKSSSAKADERVGSVRDIYDGTLPLASEVNTFSHIDRVFPSTTVRHGTRVFPLPQAARQLKDVSFLWAGREHHLSDYLSANRVAGLLVLKDGRIALERYELGTTAQTRWTSFSVVKSITSTLAAAAMQDRLIGGLDDQVTKYLPQLQGSSYDGVSVRNLLQMASGVRWNETYTDASSDRRKMLELQLQQKRGALLQFMASLPRAAEPGTRWNYNTGETYVLGALVRAAIKRPLSEYLSQKIWGPFAMEQDATWWTEDAGGLEFGGSGFAATLRDYGRFGQFVLDGGAVKGSQVVPPGWFPNAGQPKQVGDAKVPYGYMWWSEPEGAFRAYGIFGQSVYVHPREKTVIVVWSAQQQPTGSAAISDDAFFEGVLQALQ